MADKRIFNYAMSDFKETCIWMSYRYAIGRKSIASVMHAEDIAKHMEWVPMNRWEFTGTDILREVNDQIRLYKNIHIESYGNHTIDVFSVIFQWFVDNPKKDAVEYFLKHEWYIDLVKGKIVCIEERKKEIPEKTDYGSFLFENIFNDYPDYKNWIKLANLFLQKHRMVTIEFNGNVEAQKMYEWWDVRVKMSDVTLDKRYSTEDVYMQGWYACHEYIKSVL